MGFGPPISCTGGTPEVRDIRAVRGVDHEDRAAGGTKSRCKSGNGPSAIRITVGTQDDAGGRADRSNVEAGPAGKTGYSPFRSERSETKNRRKGGHRPLRENQAVAGRNPGVEAAATAKDGTVERHARSAIAAERKPRAVGRNCLQLETQVVGLTHRTEAIKEGTRSTQWKSRTNPDLERGAERKEAKGVRPGRKTDTPAALDQVSVSRRAVQRESGIPDGRERIREGHRSRERRDTAKRTGSSRRNRTRESGQVSMEPVTAERMAVTAAAANGVRGTRMHPAGIRTRARHGAGTAPDAATPAPARERRESRLQRGPAHVHDRETTGPSIPTPREGPRSGRRRGGLRRRQGLTARPLLPLPVAIADGPKTGLESIPGQLTAGETRPLLPAVEELRNLLADIEREPHGETPAPPFDVRRHRVSPRHLRTPSPKREPTFEHQASAATRYAKHTPSGQGSHDLQPTRG